MQPPKDGSNRLYRAWLTARCTANRRLRERVLDRCKHDLPYFVDSFTCQFNPAKVGREVGPFILRPVQERVLARTISRLFPAEPTNLRLDMIWEKSREEGASWMALFLFDWRSLFWARQKFLCVSHSEIAVDRPGDPDSLFWKIRFMHEHLPEWITRGVEERKLRFWYPHTKAAITGQASTGRSGVGGRATAVLLDELGKQENAAEIIGQTASTGPRLMVSTHYGVGTAFYQQTTRPDVAKELMHWSENPEKNGGLYYYDPEANRAIVKDTAYSFADDFHFVKSADTPGGPFRGLRSPWYDAEEARVGSRRDMALHHDIDPLASTWQFFEATLIGRLIRSESCRPPLWEGDLTYDPERGTPVQLVPGKGGPLRLWINPTGPCGVALGRYGFGTDISAGTGATPSCVAIGESSLAMKVGEYATADLDANRFAPLVAALGRLFADRNGREAKVCWEMAGSVGAAFGKTFMATGYRNVFYRETAMKFAGLIDPTEAPGWYPSPEATHTLMLEYRTALATGAFVNPSKSALEECLRFEYTRDGISVRHAGLRTDNPTAGTVNHGDQVVADAQCCKMVLAFGGRRPAEQFKDEPVPGGWEWRNRLHEEADRMAWVGDE